VKDGRTHTVLRGLKVLNDVGAIGSLSDGQLLEHFVARCEEAVFELLVRRHGPMVWGVCRRILRDHHDAEEAFQATFLVLARRAAAVEPRDRVGNWLYGVAYQTARKARATRTKRRGWEGQVTDLPEPEAIRDGGWDDLLPHLDRELGRLPPKYRAPIILCDLEELTHKQAAEQLGLPVGTVSGRLSRARAMLARRLSRTGVSLTGGSVAVLLAQDAASAGIPAWLIESTVRPASLIAAGRGAMVEVVSAEVAALTREVMKSMMLFKLKTVSAFLLVGFALVAGGTGLSFRARAAAAPNPHPQVATSQDRRSEAPKPKTVELKLALATAEDNQVDTKAAYPFKIDPESVYEFPELKVEYRNLRLEAGPISVIPMSTERGITGAMLIGNGTYRYTPGPGKTIEGHFRSAMLRFNPAEKDAILPLAKGKRVKDQGLSEMSRHLLQVVVRHCWHSSQQVLIPPKGTFAAVLYSKEHGDLLISGDARTAVAYSFTDREQLYEKK